MATRTLIVAIGFVSLCGATAASAQPRWGGERLPRNGACFFEDRDFGGRYFCVRPGEDLRHVPSGMNDRVSSIRLLGWAEVTVFKDSDMRGRSAHFTRDVADLRRDGWNDQISSLVVWDRTGGYGNDGWDREGIPRAGACFYEDAGFRGRHFCVPRGGSYTSLPRGFNDRISSIRVMGADVRLFRDRDFRGRSTEIHRDVADLRGDWRDSISSIRVF